MSAKKLLIESRKTEINNKKLHESKEINFHKLNDKLDIGTISVNNIHPCTIKK